MCVYSTTGPKHPAPSPKQQSWAIMKTALGWDVKSGDSWGSLLYGIATNWRQNSKCIDKWLHNNYSELCSTILLALIGTMVIRRNAKNMVFRLTRSRHFFRQMIFQFLMMICTQQQRSGFLLSVAIPVEDTFFWVSHCGDAKAKLSFAW